MRRIRPHSYEWGVSRYYRRKTVVKEGFTLVELLVSVTIVSFVGIAVYSALANGIAVWRRVNKDSSFTQNVRLTSEKMARELRNALQFSNIAFEGTEASIKFCALLLTTSGEGGDEAESHYELGRVTYFYNEGENALCKQQLLYPLIYQEQGESDQSKILISNLKELEFSYCYLDSTTGTYQWKKDWKKQEQDIIPQAVKIKMTFPEDIQQKEFEQTIFIPIGTGEQKIGL